MSLGINTRITDTREQPSTFSRGITLYVGGSGDGNYTSIQDAINNASHGDTVFVYNDSSPYYENVLVKKSINLIGEDKNTTIIDGGGNDDVVHVSTNNVKISGFKIRNSGDLVWPNQHDAGIDTRYKYTTISDNILVDNYHGIASIDGSHHTFSYNIIEQNDMHGIVTWDEGNNNIFSNTLSENVAGIWLSSSSYNTVSHNIITSHIGDGMELSGSHNTITNNTFFNDGVFVYYDEEDTNYFSGNTVNNKPLIYLDRVANKRIDEPAGQIILMHCNNITIQEQEINNTIVGIHLGYSKNCLIESCTLSNNSKSGLILHYSDNNIISNNNLISNDDEGAFVFFSSRNTFINNNISKNKITGLYLWGTSNSNSILNNNIEKNLQFGIRLWESWIYMPEYNIIGGNNIIGQGEVGLVLFYTHTTYNVIYHNNFINNTMHASYWGGGQKNKWWYNPTVQEGNYWDDYEEKYPDAKPRTDRPYIWDTPYEIAGNNKDNYPLIEPYDEFDPNAPIAPDIDGPTSGKVGIEYDYTFVTTDPNGDKVYYYIDWGDGTFEEWIGPFDSDEEVILSHTWTKKGTHAITAQAKDTNGLIGPWGTLMVTMPRNRATYNSLFLRLLEQFPILQKILCYIL